MICATILIPELENRKQEHHKCGMVHKYKKLLSRSNRNWVPACVFLVFQLHCGCFIEKAEISVNGTRKTRSRNGSDTSVCEQKLEYQNCSSSHGGYLKIRTALRGWLLATHHKLEAVTKCYRRLQNGQTQSHGKNEFIQNLDLEKRREQQYAVQFFRPLETKFVHKSLAFMSG